MFDENFKNKSQRDPPTFPDWVFEEEMGEEERKEDEAKLEVGVEAEPKLVAQAIVQKKKHVAAEKNKGKKKVVEEDALITDDVESLSDVEKE